MASLGFSIENDFKRHSAPRRRGVGRAIDDVDTLVTAQKPRSPVRTAVGLTLIAAAVALVAFALSGHGAATLGGLAHWN